jgi:hypothetical protein
MNDLTDQLFNSLTMEADDRLSNRRIVVCFQFVFGRHSKFVTQNAEIRHRLTRSGFCDSTRIRWIVLLD